MATEIERKFLVCDSFTPPGEGTKMIQGYLMASPDVTVRIRLAGRQGFLTIKGQTEGIRRAEYEYEVPEKDARELLTLCREGVVEKIRYEVPVGNHIFEVDVFEGQNQGLVVAEVELHSEDQEIEKPSWLGREVSFDRRYRNSALSKHPYRNW